VSSVSEVSVTIVFFSCFVTDGFCCVLQRGIVSEGWDGVRTNPQVHASLPAPPPLTNRLDPALHSPCPSRTHSSLPIYRAVCRSSLLCCSVSWFLSAVNSLCCFARSTWHFRTTKEVAVGAFPRLAQYQIVIGCNRDLTMYFPGSSALSFLGIWSSSKSYILDCDLST